MVKGNLVRILSAVVFITQLFGSFSFDYHHVKQWSEHDKECAGRRQSPVNIVTREIKEVLKKNLIMSGGEIKPTGVEVKNNGHTVTFSPIYPSERPSIRGGPLNGVYALDSFHLHWSDTSTNGSEHTLDGKYFPLEMHFVYYKQSYGSFKEATRKPDGLSVIGVFFDFPKNKTETPNTSVLEPIIKGISKVKKIGETADLAPFTISMFRLKKSYSYRYITYQGSLTAPPCSQVVTWFLSSVSTYVTKKQLQVFREIELAYSDQENNRPVQPVNGREFKFVWNSKF